MLSPPAKIPGQEDQDHIVGNLSWHLYGVADNSKYVGSIFTVQFYSRLDHLRTLVGDTFLVWSMVLSFESQEYWSIPAWCLYNCQTCLTNIIQLTKVWKYKFNLNLHLEQWRKDIFQAALRRCTAAPPCSWNLKWSQVGCDRPGTCTADVQRSSESVDDAENGHLAARLGKKPLKFGIPWLAIEPYMMLMLKGVVSELG